MKKVFYIGLVSLLFAFGFTTFQTPAKCNKKAMTASCKRNLDPFKYDNQKYSKIFYQNSLQLLETEVPIFSGEKYRLVFNTSGLSQPITIRVFTKDKFSKKRQPIFTSESDSDDIIIFDVPKARKLFVDYDVPLVDSTMAPINGCMFFMVGYAN